MRVWVEEEAGITCKPNALQFQTGVEHPLPLRSACCAHCLSTPSFHISARQKKKAQRWHSGYHTCTSSIEVPKPERTISATHADTILVARFVNIPRRNHCSRILDCKGVIGALPAVTVALVGTTEGSMTCWRWVVVVVAEFSRTDGVGEGLSEDGCMESVPFISVKICFPVDLFVSYSSLYHTSQDIAFIKIQESRAERSCVALGVLPHPRCRRVACTI